MNLDFKRKDFRFNARTSAVIYNRDLSKVLLFNVEDTDFYMLPGGRIEELEESIHAVKRELKEELGWDNITYTFLALSEEFVNDKGYDNHQINIIYKGIYNDEIKENKFKGLEGDWINFEWVNVSDIHQYKIFPKGIHEIIDGSSNSNHLVNNLIKESNQKE